MSLAAQDLLQPTSKIMDVAIRYQYDTQESFSKAFTRFLVPPSKIRGVGSGCSIHHQHKHGDLMTYPQMGDFIWSVERDRR
jgi:AraC-like DNA-binding protein